MPHARPQFAAHAPAGGYPSPPRELGAIVAQAAKGDQAAWSELVTRYGRRVYAMAKSRLRDHEAAEDITQGVFVTLAEKLASQAGAYQEVGRFEAYLFRIAMNRVRDEARKRKRRPTPLSLQEGDTGTPQAAEHAARDDLDELRAALAQLPDPDRRVVELRHLSQMSFKAIADLLQEPMGTLLARHHRALKKLRQVLENQTKTNMQETGD